MEQIALALVGVFGIELATDACFTGVEIFVLACLAFRAILTTTSNTVENKR